MRKLTKKEIGYFYNERELMADSTNLKVNIYRLPDCERVKNYYVLQFIGKSVSFGELVELMFETLDELKLFLKEEFKKMLEEPNKYFKNKVSKVEPAVVREELDRLLKTDINAYLEDFTRRV